MGFMRLKQAVASRKLAAQNAAAQRRFAAQQQAAMQRRRLVGFCKMAETKPPASALD